MKNSTFLTTRWNFIIPAPRLRRAVTNAVVSTYSKYEKPNKNWGKKSRRTVESFDILRPTESDVFSSDGNITNYRPCNVTHPPIRKSFLFFPPKKVRHEEKETKHFSNSYRAMI